MREGVTILDPDTTWIEDDVQIARDAVILPGCFLQGHTVIGEAAEVGPYTTLIGATTPLQFADGTVVIQDILDSMMPQMISLGLTGLMYWLIKKNVNTGWLLVIAIVGGIALSAVGILA